MENPEFNFLEGEVLLINKPLTWTSFDVVNKLRNSIRNYLAVDGKRPKIKVGHAGTLDPLASGLLIVCTGKKTKDISVIQDAEKEYTGSIKLGGITDSYDAEMPITKEFPTSHITEEKVLEAMKEFTGIFQQLPPIYSALKINGVPAYRSARQGQTPELKTREVHIKEFELVKFDPVDASIFFRVVCSKGTYIRSLAFDLGKALESGAFLSSLCRTRIGEYSLKNALELDDLVLKSLKSIK